MMMQQQSLCQAMTTECMVRDFDCVTEDCKMKLRDFIHVAEQVAMTLGFCGLLHLLG